MVWGFAAGVVTNVVGGILGAYGAKKSARQQRSLQRRKNALYKQYYSNAEKRGTAFVKSIKNASRQYAQINQDFYNSLNDYDRSVVITDAQQRARSETLDNVASVMEGQPQAEGIDQETIQAIQGAPGGLETILGQMDLQVEEQEQAAFKQKAAGERAIGLSDVQKDIQRQQEDVNLTDAQAQRDLQLALQPLQTQRTDAGSDLQLAGGVLQSIGNLLPLAGGE